MVSLFSWQSSERDMATLKTLCAQLVIIEFIIITRYGVILVKVNGNFCPAPQVGGVAVIFLTITDDAQ